MILLRTCFGAAAVGGVAAAIFTRFAFLHFKKSSMVKFLRSMNNITYTKIEWMIAKLKPLPACFKTSRRFRVSQDRDAPSWKLDTTGRSSFFCISLSCNLGRDIHLRTGRRFASKHSRGTSHLSPPCSTGLSIQYRDGLRSRHNRTSRFSDNVVV